MTRLPRIVTTSWDDGDPNDLRVAELLHSRGLAGTFYIPMVGYHGGKALEAADVKALRSEGFEIGAHGVSHNVLTGLNPRELVQEVRICKSRLEDTLSEPVQMFCYPKGRFNKSVIRHVKEAGYKGARTTRMLRQGVDFDPFQMPTGLLAYPNTRMEYAKNLVKGRNVRGLFDYVTRFIRLDSWVSMGKILFDHVLRKGGVWHLYGHSWEIEKLGLWDELEQMLDYVSRREGVRYVTNAELLAFLPEKAAPAPAPQNKTLHCSNGNSPSPQHVAATGGTIPCFPPEPGTARRLRPWAD
jgi:peptidoglycan/xylan/chitin deacetylase (PgdA/CDA1 family)